MSSAPTSTKANQLRELHFGDEILMLPNIWDPLGAILLEHLGYGAVATASASVAYSNGYADGEKIPFEQFLVILKNIVNKVNIPVTADIESGYISNAHTLEQNIRQLMETGIAGINFEDSFADSKFLFSIKEQSEKISLIRSIAGNELFINARTDVYLKTPGFSPEAKLKETIERGLAYKNAGADGFYPIILKDREAIAAISREVALPLNVLLLPGLPSFSELKNAGVARVSLGPGFLKATVRAMKDLAEKLLHFEGTEEVTANPVTSEFLQSLVQK